MRMFKLSLLGLCVTLAACQSPAPEKALSAAAPTVKIGRSPIATESTQWLAPLPSLSNAERLQIGRKALQVIDRSGQVVSELSGRFETLDHRADDSGLLVATLDKKRQQALLVRLQGDAWGGAHYLPKTRFAIEGLCLYRDSARNDYLFLLGEEGIGEQWLVAENGRPLADARLVRALSLPPASGFCQVDDRSESLYVNEENVGVWRYPAGAEAPLVREPVELLAPFGALAESAAGMAVLPDALLLLDSGAANLHLYQRGAEQWQRAGVVRLDGLDEPEQVSARATAEGLELLLIDDDGARSATLDWTPKATPRATVIPQIAPLVQTDGVPSLGDAADDPAIWINTRYPERSRVLGTDKKGGLLAYDLAGKQVQNLRAGRLNNVDIRPGFTLGKRQVDLAVASNRDHNSLHLFAIDPASGELSDIGQIATPLEDIYGLCLFKDRQGAIHAIANDKDGTFLQYRLSGKSGQATGQLARRFKTETQPEGCVADDRNERLYIGEEDVAVWALDARGDAQAELEKVIAVGGPLQDDIEGLGLYHGKQRDYLVISSQGNDSYVVVEAQAPYRLRGSFRVGLNARLGIDGASETDGLDVTSANLGGPWSAGLLVLQDGRKRMPEGNQNYKYVPWSAVADALGLE
ncbi:phytase [Phytopseudomonas dryadis]|uniref:3-phytase n=1 Tax=Phytopseudomonas dryadis TaxID=2487520 RepID=A0ABY1YZT8_9GAMM|nr:MULTISPECIES: phytase [Pseudomonas]TBU99131.1 3-phytase [Pseudomonas dryadis]TBV13409.1 3-phytase [Pseudomonas sp. FRB 230]